MNTSRIEHIWPDGHWQEAEFVSFKSGTFDDVSVGYLACTDNEGDEAHLPNMKSSTIVKLFAQFIQIDNVLREHEHGDKASAETMDNLRTIKKQLDIWLEPDKKEKNQ